MRILVVSQYYHPETVRITDLCESLAERGHRVSVLTGVPNYPKGRFFKGYSWVRKRKETINNVQITRLPILPRGNGFWGLTFNYFSFVVVGWFYSIFSKSRYDLVFNYEISPIFQCLVGIWIGKRQKIPVISYILDLWPESFQEVTGNKSKCIESTLRKIVDSIYKRSDMILASSKSFIKEISVRGIETTKLVFWPQYAEDFCFLDHEAKNDFLDDKNRPILAFTGNIGIAQGLDVLIPVAKILEARNIQVIFSLIGSGREKDRLKADAYENGVSDYFLFVDAQPPYAIPSYLKTSKAGLLILKKSKIFSMTIPAKLQTYMACGIPIIGSVDGEAQEIIIQAKSGFVAEAENVEQLATAIVQFLDSTDAEKTEMGVSAKAYANKYFRKDILLDELEDILLELVKKNNYV